MDVAKFLNKLFMTFNVAVVSAAGLPKSFDALSVRHPHYYRCLKFNPPLQQPVRERPLELP